MTLKTKAVEVADNHLVGHWREWPKMATTWMYGLGAATVGAVGAAPDLLLSLIMFLPENHWLRLAIVAVVVIVMFVGPVLVNLWKQSEEVKDDDAA